MIPTKDQLSKESVSGGLWARRPVAVNSFIGGHSFTCCPGCFYTTVAEYCSFDRDHVASAVGLATKFDRVFPYYL